MEQWTRKLISLDPLCIERFCVDDKEWQVFRETLKGLPTEEKLDRLHSWGNEHNWTRRAEVQITNYVNALKRGGQLNMQCEVVR